MKAYNRQILPVLLALVLIVSAALSSACTNLTRPENSESQPESNSIQTTVVSTQPSAAESSSAAAQPTATKKTAVEEDAISELMVDGRRLGDMSQEEKEAHAPVPAEFIVNGERVEVMPPEGINNLAEQEIFLRNMKKRVQSFRLNADGTFDPINPSPEDDETSEASADKKRHQTERAERPLDQYGVLVLREGASQKVAFLDADAISRLNGLLEPALSGQAVKPLKADYNSLILFPGKGELYFDSRDIFSTERAHQDFSLKRGDETFNMAKDSPLRDDFRSYLQGILMDPQAIFADTSVSETPRKAVARTAFSTLPDASSARLAVANSGEKSLNFSGSYFLFRYDGKGFQPQSMAATPSWSLSCPIALAPGETREVDAPFEKDYGKLERGLYCLQFSLTSDTLSRVEYLTLYFAIP